MRQDEGTTTPGDEGAEIGDEERAQRERESQQSPTTKFDDRVDEESERRRLQAERLATDPLTETADDDA